MLYRLRYFQIKQDADVTNKQVNKQNFTLAVLKTSVFEISSCVLHSNSIDIQLEDSCHDQQQEVGNHRNPLQPLTLAQRHLD